MLTTRLKTSTEDGMSANSFMYSRGSEFTCLCHHTISLFCCTCVLLWCRNEKNPGVKSETLCTNVRHEGQNADDRSRIHKSRTDEYTREFTRRNPREKSYRLRVNSAEDDLPPIPVQKSNVKVNSSLPQDAVSNVDAPARKESQAPDATRQNDESMLSLKLTLVCC